MYGYIIFSKPPHTHTVQHFTPILKHLHLSPVHFRILLLLSESFTTSPPITSLLSCIAFLSCTQIVHCHLPHSHCPAQQQSLCSQTLFSLTLVPPVFKSKLKTALFFLLISSSCLSVFCFIQNKLLISSCVLCEEINHKTCSTDCYVPL